MVRTAKIAEFKSRLSSYLKNVRNGGEVIILDRYTPVARVVPAAKTAKLSVRPPVIAHGFKNYRFKSVAVGIDAVELLRESRKDK